MGLHCLLHLASELASENRHRRASASWVTVRMGVGRPRVVGHLGKGVGGGQSSMQGASVSCLLAL